MGFKDIVKRDIKETFMNTLEFSDAHVVNGKSMPVQIDSNELIEREKRYSTNLDGVFNNQKLIYVSAEDYGPLPKHGSIMNMDGKIYKVAEAVNEGGIYSITLEANTAR